MSLILQIETATTSCSVALARYGEVLGFKEINARNVHAEVITLYIDELLNSTGVNYYDLDAIAVSSGPGSYTGLRIGVSTAKGLCFALDKPLIAVETLEAMAYGIINNPGFFEESKTLLCPMIDARRMEVYTALFDNEGNRIRETAADIIDENSFANYLKENKIIFLAMVPKNAKSVLSGNPNAKFLDDFANSATYLTQKAAQKFADAAFEDVAYYEPYYLKDFIAGKKAL